MQYLHVPQLLRPIVDIILCDIIIMYVHAVNKCDE